MNVSIESHRNFVGGEWRACAGGETFADENPSQRGSCLGMFQASSSADMAAAVDAAATAFPAWRRAGVKERQSLGFRFLEALRGAAGELAGIVARANGKTLKEARAEVDSALSEGLHHVAQITTFMGGTAPSGADGFMGWTRYEPLGVVGVISPWNFPVNVMCRKALPALLTGNTVVFKPAIFTRNTDIAHRYIDGIEAGMAHVNIHTGFKDPSLPFGGWKESGA
jgi:acyl-CoA reductase-like NAD-dependent aldehyde dehydrogenase